MIENFQNSKIWVEGVLKVIEEIFAISETEIVLNETTSVAEILSNETERYLENQMKGKYCNDIFRHLV